MKTFLQKGLGIVIRRTGDGPWCSRSFLAAIVLVLVGAAVWISGFRTPSAETRPETMATNPGSHAAGSGPVEGQQERSRPLPSYVPIAASYAAGYCIGWFFRRLIRLTLAFTAFLIALLALGRFAGCDITPARERVHQGSEWAQHELTAIKDHLLHLLPSAGAAGAGTYLGFRRRAKAPTPAGPESASA